MKTQIQCPQCGNETFLIEIHEGAPQINTATCPQCGYMLTETNRHALIQQFVQKSVRDQIKGILGKSGLKKR